MVEGGLDSLVKPDPSIAQGSGHWLTLRFVSTGEILQSNQIAESTITAYYIYDIQLKK